MTKKEQNALLRNAISRLHFHRTISESAAHENQVVEALMNFAQALHAAEVVESKPDADKDTINKAFDAAYATLKEIK